VDCIPVARSQSWSRRAKIFGNLRRTIRVISSEAQSMARKRIRKLVVTIGILVAITAGAGIYVKVMSRPAGRPTTPSVTNSNRRVPARTHGGVAWVGG